MKRIVLLFVAFCLINFSAVHAQAASTSDLLEMKYSSGAQEIIFVHHNASLFFTGEYLFYKVYCINGTTRKPSRLSRIAYVELVGEDHAIVFKHKIALNNGLGQSDFFIPTNVPSGNYKLIAYTQRMRNIGTSSFFQADISIINPYRENQKAILSTETDDGGTSEINSIENKIPVTNVKTDNYSEFKLLLNGRKFKKREEVNLVFKNFIRQKGFGNYSLSVAKIDDIPNLPKQTAVSYDATINSGMTSVDVDNNGSILFPSESKGSLVSGTVFDKATKLPANAKDVAISIPGKDFFFEVTSTNDIGEFSFSIDPKYNRNNAFIQVVDETKENYKIEIDKPTLVDYTGISFASFRIDALMKEAILERSVYNQIENGYYSVKPDTIKSLDSEKHFAYYEKTIRYDLDDYTRFSTMEEVFREIVKLVWTTKEANGKTGIRVFNYEHAEPTDNPPLVIVDGIFVQDHEDLLAFNARNVQKVNIIRNQYQFGAKEYQGVILIETIQGDYRNDLPADYSKELLLFKPEQRKYYYRQAYDESNVLTSNRIPDYRRQLLWEPYIDLSTNEMNFRFYTSDNIGDYEISLEGYTRDGRPVSLREVITIE